MKKWLAGVVLGLGLAGAAQAAALIDNLNGTVTDPNTNLIWLKDWDVNGAKSWDAQKSWAENLDFAGSSNWQLPSILEYRALHIAYGNFMSISTFADVQGDYWSATEFGSPTTGRAWEIFQDGFEREDVKFNAKFAVAVRAADVTGRIPEPQALMLVLAALGAAAVVRRRRPQ